jgi:predicted dehydrogenase
MFVAGMSPILEPPVTDLWTVPGEEALITDFVREESEFFNNHTNAMEYYHERNIEDFLQAVRLGKEPLITGRDGRVTVEIFTAIYRSTRDGMPVTWPLAPEKGKDYDGRIRG